MDQIYWPFFTPGAGLMGLFILVAILLWMALPFLVFSLWFRTKKMKKTLERILPILQKQTQLLEQIAAGQKTATTAQKGEN